ncbi:MAG: outer membrane beta-barrel protein [Bacteroidales bacterium]
MRKIILCIVLIKYGIFISAQEQCAFILEEAQEMFGIGLIEAIPDKLAPCLESGFTKDEKLQAHKLIILAYLFDDNYEMADNAMLAFLSEFPSYEPVATDPRVFIALMETYDTKPVLMMGGSIGLNFTVPLVTGRVGTYNFQSYHGKYVPGGAGYHGSFRVDKVIRPGMVLSGELMFANNRFDFYLDGTSEITEFSGEITDFSQIEYYETQNSISLPISIRYQFREGPLFTFTTIGICPGLLLSATGEGKRDYINTNFTRYNPIEVSNVNILDKRRMFTMRAFAGFGVKYNIGPGEFFLDARYYVDLLSQVKPGVSRYVNDIAMQLFYVNDNLLLTNLAISAGYVFPIYRPKKKIE